MRSQTHHHKPSRALALFLHSALVAVLVFVLDKVNSAKSSDSSK